MAFRRTGIKLLAGLGVLAAILLTAYLIMDEPRPQGSSGPAADALAREMMAAIHHNRWDSTGAIHWNFAGKHQLLWDKKRHLARVRWDEKEALVNLNDRTGRALRDGEWLSAAEGASLVQEAWEIWCNDAFWLNPISKLFDPGTIRRLISLEDGGQGLLVTYQSGGVTPGDAYLWFPDDNGLPKRWKIWVSVVPLGGVEFSWEGWTVLSTGVKISTLHRKGPFEILRLSDVRAAATLEELAPGPDPFAPLYQQ